MKDHVCLDWQKLLMFDDEALFYVLYEANIAFETQESGIRLFLQSVHALVTDISLIFDSIALE